MEDLQLELLGSYEFLQSSSPNPNAFTSSTLISAFYQKILKRAADSAGLAGWSSQLSNILNTDNRKKVAKGIMDSGEGRGRFIGDLYSQFFNRTPASWEVQHWVSVFNSNGSRLQMLHDFLASQENLLKTLN